MVRFTYIHGGYLVYLGGSGNRNGIHMFCFLYYRRRLHIPGFGGACSLDGEVLVALCFLFVNASVLGVRPTGCPRQRASRMNRTQSTPGTLYAASSLVGTCITTSGGVKRASLMLVSDAPGRPRIEISTAQAPTRDINRQRLLNGTFGANKNDVALVSGPADPGR